MKDFQIFDEAAYLPSAYHEGSVTLMPHGRVMVSEYPTEQLEYGDCVVVDPTFPLYAVWHPKGWFYCQVTTAPNFREYDPTKSCP